MASQTTNYGLNKHGPQDFYNVEARNENWDKIDEALAATDPTKITAKAAPADDDGVMIADSADGGKAKRLLWSNVKAALGKLFVPLARTVNGKTLSADVTLTGDTIPVSATDPTPVSEALTASRGGVNPNLLDNWYFANPINQRGKTEWTNANDYTIDRWKPAGSGKISLTDGGIKCEDIYLHQFFEKGFLGKGTYTISVLTKNSSGNFSGTFGFWGAGVDKGFSATLDNGFATATFTVAENHDDYNPFIYLGLHNSFLAAKLELGSTQTLAHKEGDKWVLNEIPNFGEQLRRCQRFHLGDMQRDAPGRISGSTTAYCVVPIPVTMRQSSATPVQAFSKYGNIVDKDGGFHVVNNAYCVVEADSYLLFAVSSTETMPVGPCVWQDAHFSVSKDL